MQWDIKNSIKNFLAIENLIRQVKLRVLTKFKNSFLIENRQNVRKNDSD